MFKIKLSKAIKLKIKLKITTATLYCQIFIFILLKYILERNIYNACLLFTPATAGRFW